MRTLKPQAPGALCWLALGAMVWALTPARALAADLEWINTSGGLLFYDTDTNWNPVNAPDDADNVLFADDVTLTIVLGATSNANNFTVTAGDWTFTGGSGTSLDTEGVLRIDDASLLTGAAATLTGPSSWHNLGDAVIGDAGLGTFTVEAGAVVDADQMFVGNQAGSVGEVTATGAGTILRATLNSNTGVHVIGNAGGTGTMHILNGAQLRTTGTGGNDIWVGSGTDGGDPATASTGTLNIDGAGSFAETEDLNVGIFGGIGFLNITNGAQVVNTDGGANGSPDTTFGVNLGPNDEVASGTGVVDGDGSLLRSRSITVGGSGIGRLTVSGGGVARTLTQGTAIGDMFIGLNSGTDGKVAVVGSGVAASLLDVDQSLFVGDAGLGVLHIGRDLNGNVVGSGALQVDIDLRIGDNTTNTQDNRVIIDGANANANVGGVTYVGLSGRGTLEVLGGAALTGNELRVAQNGTSTGGDMAVRGGSTASFTGSAAIGNDATGTLLIDGASTMTVEDIFWVGFDDGEGTVTVRDAGSELRVNTANASDVYIGGENTQTGGTGTVNVENGALFTTQRHVYIGGNATGNGTVNVTGPGSEARFYDNAPVDAANEVTYIGFSGAGALNVTDGGLARNEIVRIGENAGAAAADVLVSGVNDAGTPGDPGDDTPSSWNIFGDIVVGTNRTGTLLIEQGAQVTSQTGPITATSYIGFGAASDGSTATVTGAGSQWLHEHYLYVANSGGNAGNQVQLNVLDGGLVEATFMPIAVADGSYGVVNVDGAGSTLRLITNAKSGGIGDIRMVSGGSNGTAIVNVTGGGLIDLQTNLEIGRGDAAGNATVNVSGAGSTIDAGGQLTVAYDNSNGTLNVSDGGAVANAGHAYISRLDGNGTANIGAAAGLDAGHAQASWTVGTPSADANLYISGSEAGNAGANVGTLNVNPTGKVTVNGLLRVWNRGVINLNGGVLEFQSIDLTDSSSIIVTDPTMNFNSGTLRFLESATLTSNTLTPMLGASQTLTADRHLAVVGAATLSTGLRLNGGTLSVGSIAPASIANLDFDAGTFNLTASNLQVTAGGLFGDNLTITPGQTINVMQTAEVAADGTLIVQGGFSSAGLTNLGTTVLIDTTIDGPVTNPGGSAIDIVGDVTFTGLFSGGGAIFGSGTADFQGGFSPGDSPATVNVEGSVTLGNTNTLFIELGGTTPGQFDRLEIGGFASLDGTLDVTLINGFVPGAGDSFGLLVAGAGYSGTFHTLNLPDLSAQGLAWQLNPGGATLFLEVIAALQGDLNADGFVGIEDLNIVLGNWNQNVSPGDPLFGDPSGDGFVGIEDLNFVLGNWNAGTPPGGASAAIPEPGALAVVALGLTCALRRQHHG